MSSNSTQALAAPRSVARGSRIRVWAGAIWLHRWFALWVCVLVALGFWQGVRVLLGPAVVVDRLQSGDLVQTVVASGNVLTPYRVNIGAQITGTVLDVLVEEGQEVTKGQQVIILENSELKAALVQAQGALDQARTRMRQLVELTLPTAKEALKQAQATEFDAQQTYDRTAKLAQDGYATRASLDDARRDLDIAQTQVRSAELQVYSTSPGGSDYVTAETQLNQAMANLDTAKARFDYATIRAPRDGVLITRNVERGTVVQPGVPLLVLAPKGTVQLQLQVDERDLGALALGQKAQASADAYPDQKFEAIVSYINPGVDISRATVEVKLDVVNPAKYLVQDMTVSVDVEVARRNATHVLRSRDVHDILTQEPWVLTIKDGRAVRRRVKLGIRGNTQVEILDGLEPGAPVIPVTAGVLNGQKVRAIDS
ncbi:efflux RND transporter periplasmic adaptor subunit [Methylovirgula sp. 4M-Z18]|uniref:efflux RND transporter periplasmic adaptor subunit n=1 Tax=Methylovirgula sp. 4M-Z18 TaxID=2293567 RepID=UPI000E2E4A4A|nr:efflux RND transporter periplasmic adaptor subunit [Methylovirgula sp. 4M-Z18]RFB76474.1 efflux RND transporter periplasmic adaptor subunit [Methylovirgula sp. 4M-Z18]